MTRAALFFACFWMAFPPVFAQEPVRLAPRFTPGQVMRYALDLRTEQEGAMSGAIQNPQGLQKAEIAVSAVIRMEVLSREPGNAAVPERFRLRGTYEKVASTTKLDVPDPDADSERNLAKLEGRSVEFTVDATGKVSEVAGLKDVLPEESGQAAQWLGHLGLGGGAPPGGVVPGQTWSAGERAIEGAPLAGLVWRGESTYLRNEPCRPNPQTGAAVSAEVCAVILTRFEVIQRNSSADATPEEFRRNFLKSAGRMSGSGESLAYLSLQTGWLVSVTQTSSEASDVTITALESGLQVRYASKMRTESSLALVAGTAPR